MRCRLYVVLNRAAINGAIRQLSHWLPALDPDRFAVRIAFLRDPGPLADSLAIPGTEVRHRFLRCRYDAVGAFRLILDARSWHPHVVFSLDERNATLLARLAGLLTRARVVQAIHSSPRRESPVPLWDRVTRGVVATTVAVSQTHRELLVSRGLPREGVHVVYNGVPSRANIIGTSGTEQVIGLFVGVLREDKRVDLLIRALAEIRERAPYLTLSIVGAGPIETSLRALAERIGVEDRISWEGWQENSGQYLERGSFLVLPSDPGVETLSMAVLEAMAAGLPVICTDVGSMREAVDESVGFLVPPGDASSLAQAMLELYTSKAMRLQKGLAAATRQRERFSSDRLAAEMERLLRAEACNGTGH
jgi:glycosyltransferase involved in cell wall biosynthesis